jgi:signal transduction histidine kinase
VSDAEHLAVVVHELRSPVAALTALLEAAPATRDPDGRRRLVKLAVAADPELLSLRLERVDVGALASSFAGDTVSVRVDGRPTATADPTRLRQAIANLVANGLRHGSHVVIDVAERDGAGIVVEVTDDGTGIDAGIDPFARGVSGAGSSGIGLWLARAVAEAHGGSLEVVREAGGGARFRLALRSASGAG